MKLNSPQEYELQLFPGGKYSILGKNSSTKFSSPASRRGIAKLYTISSDSILLYVGITQQPMATRLNYGFKAKGEGGYHGYKWKNIDDLLHLTIWTASNNGDYVAARELETVEAEVAFLYRQNSGQWPKFQHEIHFYPSNTNHRVIAAQIYDSVISQ